MRSPIDQAGMDEQEAREEANEVYRNRPPHGTATWAEVREAEYRLSEARARLRALYAEQDA